MMWTVQERLLSRPRIRAALGRCPATRRIADRHARALFSVVAGAARSQMLLAAVELGLFERLLDTPKSEAEIAAELDLPEEAAAALVQALAASGLLERRGGRVGLAIGGLVVATDPGLRAMILHGRLLAEDMRDPVALLRAPGSGRIAAFWPYRGAGEPSSYTALMAASIDLVADCLLAAHDFGRHSALLDVGGGDGRLAKRIARLWPRLRVGLAELPDAAAIARDRLAGAGASVEVHDRAGDDAPLPGGYDAVLLSRVLHDRDDWAAANLLASVRAALPRNGTLIVAEPLAREGDDPQTAYFAAYFVAMGAGRLRTWREIRAMLRTAGFRRCSVVARSPTSTIIVARSA